MFCSLKKQGTKINNFNCLLGGCLILRHTDMWSYHHILTVKLWRERSNLGGLNTTPASVCLGFLETQRGRFQAFVACLVLKWGSTKVAWDHHLVLFFRGYSFETLKIHKVINCSGWWMHQYIYIQDNCERTLEFLGYVVVCCNYK